MRRGAVASGTLDKWLRRLPLEGQAVLRNCDLTVRANGGLTATLSQINVTGRFQLTLPSKTIQLKC